MRKSVSIVVPVYRVEQYLDRCVKSILAQTFPDFELILVDDGSPDRCPQMCDEWAEKDDRIVVIHKKNGGLPDARNYGIQEAKGEYLAFVDSDDWVEPEFLETLYKGIVENEADVVQCNYRRVSESKSELVAYDTRLLDETDIQSVLWKEMVNAHLTTVSNSRWNKLYRTNLAKVAIGLCDISISMGEDFLMNFAVFGLCKKIAVLNTPPLYNYYFNPNSISSGYHQEYKYGDGDFYANLKRIAAAYGCDTVDIKYMVNRRCAGYIFECAISDWSMADKKKEIREIIGMLDRKLWFSVIKTYDDPSKRLCLYLSYFGMTDLMLLMVDFRLRMLRKSAA